MTAEELLMMSDEIETYSADDALVIDAENRIILTPAGGLLLGVESDEEAERIKFVCPRIVGDNIDLSTLQLRAIYRNANGDKDFRICTDITIDGENIRFSWLLSRKVTRYKGAVNFIICAIRTQSDGSIKNEWNTTLAEGKVLEGLEVDISEEEFEEPKDIVLQLLGMLDEKEAELLEEVENLRADVKADIETTKQKAMDDVEAKGAETLKTIPEDYTYVYNLAEENKQLKASAIKRTYSGETIVATDSSQAKFEGLRVLGRSEQVSTTGKNRLENNIVSKTKNGITITKNKDGSITLNGTCTGWFFENLDDTKTRTLPDGDYILSGGLDSAYLTQYIDGASVGMSKNKDLSFTMTSENVSNYTRLEVASSAILNNVTIYPMIRLASIEDDTYEPFTGGLPSPSPEYPQPIESVGDDGSVDVGVYGAQLFDASKLPTTSVGGATVTNNGDGSFTVSGSGNLSEMFASSYALSDEEFNRVMVVGNVVKYKADVSTCPYIMFGFYDNNSNRITAVSNNKDFDQCVEITENILANTKNIMVFLFGGSGKPIVTGTFKPMIYIDGNGTWEPYKTKQALPISTPNGLPGIQVTDASLATYTDENGVMWCADEVDFARGKYVQRIGEWVYDGSELVYVTNNEDYCQIQTYINGTILENCICTHLRGQKGYTSQNKPYVRTNGTGIWFEFSYGEYSDNDDFKAFLAEQYANGTPVIVKYILSEPIEVPLSTSEIEAYKALNSNYPTTTILNDENAHMEVTLVADTKNHIEQNYVSKESYDSMNERLLAVEQALLSEV